MGTTRVHVLLAQGGARAGLLRKVKGFLAHLQTSATRFQPTGAFRRPEEDLLLPSEEKGQWQPGPLGTGATRGPCVSRMQ